jgi:hypothetical protein
MDYIDPSLPVVVPTGPYTPAAATAIWTDKELAGLRFIRALNATRQLELHTNARVAVAK